MPTLLDIFIVRNAKWQGDRLTKIRMNLIGCQGRCSHKSDSDFPLPA